MDALHLVRAARAARCRVQDHPSNTAPIDGRFPSDTGHGQNQRALRRTSKSAIRARRALTHSGQSRWLPLKPQRRQRSSGTRSFSRGGSRFKGCTDLCCRNEAGAAAIPEYKLRLLRREQIRRKIPGYSPFSESFGSRLDRISPRKPRQTGSRRPNAVVMRAAIPIRGWMLYSFYVWRVLSRSLLSYARSRPSYFVHKTSPVLPSVGRCWTPIGRPYPEPRSPSKTRKAQACSPQRRIRLGCFDFQECRPGSTLSGSNKRTSSPPSPVFESEINPPVP